MSEPPLEEGWIDRELAEEFPDLALAYTRIVASSGKTPPEIRDRMGALAGRITGGKVVHMRQDRIPWAYRVFWRQVGIDPDSDRTPVERIALDRLIHGGLRSRNLLDDVVVIATLETGVPVVAFDAEKVGEAIGLRPTRTGEELAERHPLSTRQIVYADEERPLALLSGEVSPDRGVTPGTRRMVLAALSVKGVPRISVEEALWIAADLLMER